MGSFMGLGLNRFRELMTFSAPLSNSGSPDYCAILLRGRILFLRFARARDIRKRRKRKGRRMPSMCPSLHDLCAREVYAVKFQLTQDLFDALIPAGQLGYLSFMDEGLIGLAGVVSSLMGAYTQWVKTK